MVGRGVAGCARADGDLDGNWFGSILTNAGISTFSVTIASNQITSFLIGGTNQGSDWTGTLSEINASATGDLLFNVSFADGSTGAIFANAAGDHALFARDDGGFGAVGVAQTGASALPTYAFTDLDGSWGQTVVYNLHDYSNDAGSGTCTAGMCSFTFSAGPVHYDLTYGSENEVSDYGLWSGFFNDSQSLAGFTFLSADKTFAGSVACPLEFVPLSDCAFGAWTRP